MQSSTHLNAKYLASIGYFFCFLSFFLGSRPLHSYSLWVDEAYSALLARMSFSEIHQALVYDAGPPLYYDLLHIWRIVLGESELALRCFSFLFAAITAILIYQTGIRFLTRKTASGMTLLWCILPLSIYYAQEARNYTLLVAETTGLAYVLLSWLKDKKPWQWMLFAFLGFSLVYTHNVGWFVLLSSLIAGVLYSQGKHRWLLLTAFGLVIILYLPWIPTLRAQMRNTHMTIDWVQNFWSPGIVLQTFSTYLPGGTNPAYLGLPTLPIWGQIALATLLGLPVVYTLIVRYKEIPQPVVVLSVILFGSLLLPYLYSCIKGNIYLPGRTDFCVYPLACLLVAYCIDKLPKENMRLGLGIIVLIPVCIVSGIYHTQQPPLSEKEIVKYLHSQSRNGGIVLCTGLTRPAIEYYLAPLGFQIESYPKVMEHHLAHINESWLMSNVETEQEITRVLEQIKNLPSDQTYWIVGSNRDINKPLFSALEAKGLSSPPIQSPGMGLRKLNEPAFLMRIDPRKVQDARP